VIEVTMNKGVLLTRYWLRVRDQLGFGVTAYSVEDARLLLTKAGVDLDFDSDVLEIVQGIDIRTLDQNHVAVNMGPPNLRGVWIPMLNL
jgi:hypothetical protein